MAIRTGAWLLAVSAVLAGCSSDAAPRTLPSLVTPAPTTTSSVAAPIVPDDATKATSAGASSFARHYMQLVEYSFAAGDPRALTQVSDPACVGCNNLIRAVTEAANAGQRARGGEITVLSVAAPPVAMSRTNVDVRYKRGLGSIVSPKGDVIGSIPAQPPTDVRIAVLRNSPWVVTGYDSATQ